MSDFAGELADEIAGAERVVEVGVGRRPDVAERLAARGVSVVATDIVTRETPPGVEFVVDDVTTPDRSVYEGADVVFARNLPPELQRPVADVAVAVGAACYFTTLGGDPAVVPVERRTLGRETLFVVSRN
ncbi:UPF0146 family protein [Salarchaeum sp. III]|uniref:UPF0146 family protein n=1 Tax=Salarchaeum sp. III TaxID=3107927 RepID=UPI003FA6B422